MLGAIGKRSPVRSSLTSGADLGTKACGGKHSHTLGRKRLRRFSRDPMRAKSAWDPNAAFSGNAKTIPPLWRLSDTGPYLCGDLGGWQSHR